jgi:hypothetical protein
MPENRSNVAIPAAVITAITTSFTAIQTALAPYVTPLSEDDRKGILKMSEKSETFVGKSLDYAGTNPEFMPAFGSVSDFQLDFGNVTALNPISKLALQVANDLNDTAMVAGHEAFASALMYYNNVSQGNKNGVASSRTIYADLSQRFPGRPKKQAVTPPPATPAP